MLHLRIMSPRKNWPELHYADHWEAKAARARAAGDRLTDPCLKQMMLQIAAQYSALSQCSRGIAATLRVSEGRPADEE
jgi:hypothetical protein